MRLIDADALAKFIDYGHLNNPNEKLYSENDIREMIDMMPVIDVVLDFQAETPKHGHWIEHEVGLICSECGHYTEAMYDEPFNNEFGKGWALKRPYYCGYCGAKMDGERREDGKTGKG